MSALHNIHIGTSGWSYKHWRNLFYPQEVKPAHWFQYYANQFCTVELNSSFYRLPLLKTVRGLGTKGTGRFFVLP